MKEEWRDIIGYEGLYQVSSLGRVKSLRKNIIMKFITRSGYYNLVLRKNGQRKSKQVHRLVAEAFIPNPDNLPIVNHIDYNRKNNKVENLEWCTQKQNVLWSVCNMKKRRESKTNSGEQYICLRKNNFYELTINKKYYGRYKNIDEAIKKRNEILNEINNTK